MCKLHESINRKFVDSINVSEWEIETDTGFVDLQSIHKTIEYDVWFLETESGKKLLCADTHIVFDDNMNEVFVCDLVANDSLIQTKSGVEKVTCVHKKELIENMFDVTVDSKNHRLYTNDILSHNTITTAAYLLWFVLFNAEKTVAILAHKAPVARAILGRIMKAYENIPFFLQPGCRTLNKGLVELGNGSNLVAEATTGDGIRSYSCVDIDSMVTVKIDGEIKTIRISELLKLMPEKQIVLNTDSLEGIYQNLNNIEILTPLGFKKFDGINVTKNNLWLLKTETHEIKVTDNHKVFSINLDKYIEVNTLSVGDLIQTQSGPEKVTFIQDMNVEGFVADFLEVEDCHSYFSNGILNSNCAIIYLDEFAWVKNAEEFFTGTFPVISSGNTTKLLISSTPNGLNLFYKFWKDAKEGRSNLVPTEIHWHEVPGRDEKWKEEQLQVLGDHKFRQEHGNEFLGSANTLIAGWKLQELTYETAIKKDDHYNIIEEPKESFVCPKCTKILSGEDGFCIECCVTSAIKKKDSYMAIVDGSRGINNDYSTITMINISEYPFRVAATYRNDEISTLLFPNIIVDFCRKYNNAYLLVERNNMGDAIAKECAFEEEYENIIFAKSGGRKGQITSLSAGKTFFPGVEMTKSVKRIGCSILKNLIEENKLISFTEDMVLELYNFVGKSDSFEADKGKHDDLVMNLVLFSWFADQPLFKEITDINIRGRVREAPPEQKILFFKSGDAEDEDVSGFGVTEEMKETFRMLGIT